MLLVEEGMLLDCLKIVFLQLFKTFNKMKRIIVSATGDCSSLNSYDPVGIDYPNVGLRLHAIVNCWEK